jgi:hydroxybutyrate-dimer hydrolase
LPCDLHFGFTDANGRARVGTSAEWARVFSDSNGVPPTAGITWLLPSNDGPRSVPALPLPTVQCLRGLYTDAAAPAHRALLAGLAQLPIAARPGDRPVLVLHGRADGLILPQHSSHAYVAAASRHGAAGLRYIELQHAQHFDAFVAAPGMSDRYVPTQPWLLAAIDAVYARLTRSRPLPPSQVVRTRPGEPLGVLASQPLAGDRIELRRGRLRVPE